jgi:hypothetical protein
VDRFEQFAETAQRASCVVGNTIDGDGMQDVLEKHSDQLQHHVEKAMRKANG